MGFFKTMGLRVRAEKLAPVFSTLRKKHFEVLVQILKLQLAYSVPFGRDTLGAEADLALKSFQMYISTSFVFEQRYVTDNDRKEFYGYLNMAAFDKVDVHRTTSIENFFVELSKYHTDRSRQFLMVTKLIAKYLILDFDSAASTIVSKSLFAFEANTKLEIARVFGDKPTFELFEARSKAARTLLFTDIDPPVGSFCQNCSNKVSVDANYCIHCGSKIHRYQNKMDNISDKTAQSQNSAKADNSSKMASLSEVQSYIKYDSDMDIQDEDDFDLPVDIPDLPSIDLVMAELCQKRIDLTRKGGEQAYWGITYAFRLNELRSASIQKRQNLDDAIRYHLIDGFTRHPPKGKALIWFGIRQFSTQQEFITLTLSDPRSQMDATWLSYLPGFFESGREAVSPLAVPFAVWDGHNLHRTYVVDADEIEIGPLANDFFSGQGLVVGPVENDMAEKIARKDPDCWEYSLIPNDREEPLIIGERKMVILHSFANLRYIVTS